MRWLTLTDEGRRNVATICRVAGWCLTIVGVGALVAGIGLGLVGGWLIGTDVTSMPQWTSILWVPLCGVLLAMILSLPGVFLVAGGDDLRTKAKKLDEERRRHYEAARRSILGPDA